MLGSSFLDIDGLFLTLFLDGVDSVRETRYLKVHLPTDAKDLKVHVPADTRDLKVHVPTDTRDLKTHLPPSIAIKIAT